MGAEPVLALDVGIILVVAAAFGLLAHRTGQPSIVAYIVAGLLIGPAVLGIVSPNEITETMAELGLAFLLFLLGIKMRFEDVRHILRPIVLVALPQILLVFLAGTGIAMLLGFSVVESVVIGLAVKYSSTAVVIKMLTGRNETATTHGKLDVGILLVQDVVVVVLLAMLATGQPEGVADVAVTLGTILALIVLLGIVAILAARYVLPVVFRRIAGRPDTFFLIAVSWAFLFVLVAQEFELSIEMGAFLAGLSIAQLPYSKGLQGRINPLTDLFILVFFVSVGLRLEAADLLAHWEAAVIAAALLVPTKFLVYLVLIDRQGFDRETTLHGSLNMVQVSEFGLVVGTAAMSAGYIAEPILGFLSLVAILTIGVSVYLIAYDDRLIAAAAPLIDRWRPPDEDDEELPTKRGHGIVVGYDEIAHLTADTIDERLDVIYVDRKPGAIEALARAGHDALFGDFRHEAVRKEAGLHRAGFVLSCSVERDVNLTILEEAPDEAVVFLEARNAEDADAFYEAGADYVILSAAVAVEQLEEYLDTYLANPSAFDADVASDIADLREHRPPDLRTADGEGT